MERKRLPPSCDRTSASRATLLDFHGFVQDHRRFPVTSYIDLLYLLTKPLTYYTANYRDNFVFTSVSNKVTLELISDVSKHECFESMAFEHTSDSLALLNWYFLNKHWSLSTWAEISGSFLSQQRVQISCGLITQAQSSTSLRRTVGCVISGCEKELHLQLPKQYTLRDLISSNA